MVLGVPVGIPDRRSRSPEELRLLWYQIGDEGYRGTSAPARRAWSSRSGPRCRATVNLMGDLNMWLWLFLDSTQ